MTANGLVLVDDGERLLVVAWIGREVALGDAQVPRLRRHAGFCGRLGLLAGFEGVAAQLAIYAQRDDAGHADHANGEQQALAPPLGRDIASPAGARYAK
ncbi:MAG: hypothetical protein IPL79_07215 [Myxococcales bacterium]|nr:hypothetical protein [Myxococcales bacterium]